MLTIKDDMVRAFDDADRVVIDMTAVDIADLSLIQLVEAARAHARSVGKPIVASAPANDVMAGLLERAGFATRSSADPSAASSAASSTACSGASSAGPDDFWSHGVSPR